MQRESFREYIVKCHRKFKCEWFPLEWEGRGLGDTGGMFLERLTADTRGSGTER